jgi:hypothetical protein
MSIFHNIVGVLRKTVEGILDKMPISELVVKMLFYIPDIIKEIKNIIKKSSNGLTSDEIKEIIDSGLIEFDELTGVEGIKLLKDIIPSSGGEEQTLDLFKFLTRNILYGHFNIPIPKESITITYDNTYIPVQEKTKTKCAIIKE